MARISTITLRDDAVCHKCGADLAKGRRARFVAGRIFCPTNAHGGALTKAEARQQAASRSIALGDAAFRLAHGQITQDQHDAIVNRWNS